MWFAGASWWATRCPVLAMLLFRSPADGGTVFDARIPTAAPFTRGDVTEPGCKRHTRRYKLTRRYGKKCKCGWLTHR